MMIIYTQDIEEAKHRVDAWWAHEIIDRPAPQVCAPKNPPVAQSEPPRDMSPDRVKAWFMDPEQVIPSLRRQLADTYFGGEEFPVAGRMVAIMAAYLGLSPPG